MIEKFLLPEGSALFQPGIIDPGYSDLSAYSSIASISA